MKTDFTAPKPCSALPGLGDPQAIIRVYTGNRPEFVFEGAGEAIYPLREGDIHQIGQACGNGWRKVFNVYAKFVFALHGWETLPGQPLNWQSYRDKTLLQPGSNTALMFDPPEFQQPNAVHIIMGRTYAASLQLPFALDWLTAEFAVDSKHRTIVCPYFDYRQLSNIKIDFLVALINQHSLVR